MKFFTVLSLSLLSLSVFAQEDLNSMKNKANSHIDKKMSSLQAAKSCINGAQSMDKFKSCKYDMHEDMKMQKMEMNDEKKAEKQSQY